MASLVHAQNFPSGPVTHHRAVSARRRDRRARPRAQPPSAEPVGPAGRDRISSRRRRPDRHAAGGERAGRRLHAVDGVDRRDPDAGEQTAAAARRRQLRHHPRPRADLTDRRAALHPGGQSVAAGENRRRAHRLCQAESRQAVVRLVRRRLRLASFRCAVRAGWRGRPAACALSRDRAGGHRTRSAAAST